MKRFFAAVHLILVMVLVLSQIETKAAIQCAHAHRPQTISLILQSEWAEGARPSAALVAELEALVALSPAQKSKRLREESKKSEGLPSELRRLALNDSQGWNQFFEQSLSLPQQGITILGNMQFLTKGISPPIRRQLLEKIGSRYMDAKKGSSASREEARKYHFEKRILSAWIKVLLRPAETFLSRYEETRDPVKSLQAVIDSVNDQLLPYLPPHQGYGTLRAVDLMNYAQETQKVLKEDQDFYRQKKLDWVDKEIILFGSTMKGLSKNDSDLDLNLVVPRNFDFEKWNADWYLEGTPDGMTGIAPRIRRWNERNHPGFRLELDHFGFFVHPGNRFSFMSFSAFESLVFVIKANSIDLILFSDQTRIEPGSLRARTNNSPNPRRIEYRASSSTTIPVWRE